MKTIAAAVACVVGASLAVEAGAGPEWMESGDAGNLPASAQAPTGGTTLAKISGELGGAAPRGGSMGDFQDMYEIIIKDVDEFSATVTDDAGGPTFDTQLWLFDAAGRGVLGNNDSSVSPVNGGSAFGNMATDATGSRVMGTGRYFLAISGLGSSPLDGAGNLIFNIASGTEVSGPDGSTMPISGWTGPGATGFYTITLTGASFVPAPGAGALLAIAGTLGLRRRR